MAMGKATVHLEEQRYTRFTQQHLSADDYELYELANLADIHFDPKVFRIVLDLIKLNVAPIAIERMLKTMLTKQRKTAHSTSSSQSHSTVSQHQSSVTSHHHSRTVSKTGASSSGNRKR